MNVARQILYQKRPIGSPRNSTWVQTNFPAYTFEDPQSVRDYLQKGLTLAHKKLGLDDSIALLPYAVVLHHGTTNFEILPMGVDRENFDKEVEEIARISKIPAGEERDSATMLQLNSLSEYGMAQIIENGKLVGYPGTEHFDLGPNHESNHRAKILEVYGTPYGSEGTQKLSYLPYTSNGEDVSDELEDILHAAIIIPLGPPDDDISSILTGELRPNITSNWVPTPLPPSHS